MHIGLSKPISLSIKGQQAESKVLNIEEPCMGNIEEVAKLKEIMGKGLMTLSANAPAEQNDSQSEADMKDSDMIMMMQMGGVYASMIKEFKSFLLKNGSLDDEPLSSHLLNKMDLRDFEKALGRYSKDFLFISNM
jgi:hypothetical protein